MTEHAGNPDAHGPAGSYNQAPPPAHIYDPPLGPLVVVAEGERWVAVDKPSGLLSVPGRTEDKQDCARSRLELQYPDATGPITVHRLDMDTSGILLMALDPRAQATLSRQFMKRKTKKKYLAVLDGHVEHDEGEVDLPLNVDWPNRPKKKVDYDEGKPSLTKYTVLDRYEDEHGPRTRIEFEPITGRSHQLRVHAAHPVDRGGLGCPIAGDSLYGREDSADRLLLHASWLMFYEPDTPNRTFVECEPPF